MTPRSCFGKMNSILGSVVPLAMFLKKFYLSADEAFDGSYQSNVLVSDEGKNMDMDMNMDLLMDKGRCQKRFSGFCPLRRGGTPPVR